MSPSPEQIAAARRAWLSFTIGPEEQWVTQTLAASHAAVRSPYRSLSHFFNYRLAGKRGMKDDTPPNLPGVGTKWYPT